MEKGPKMFGREMPKMPKKVAELPPRERHEVARDAMYEKILEHTDAVLGFIDWADSVTEDMTEEEVGRALTLQVEHALQNVPVEVQKNERKLVLLQAERGTLFRTIFLDDNKEPSPELGQRYIQLDDDIEALENAQEQSEESDYARCVMHWEMAMRHALAEVRALHHDADRAADAVNRILEERGDAQFKKEDVVRTVFLPFCVQFVLKNDAFIRVNDNNELGGFYLTNSNFAFVAEGDNALLREVTIAHEYGHRLLSDELRHGRDQPTSITSAVARVVHANKNAPAFEREYYEQMLIKAVAHSAFDNLQNEFVAEMNAMRTTSPEKISNHYWATAERDARKFRAELSDALAPLEDRLNLVKKLERSADNMVPRFERAKEGVTHALYVAAHLEDDSARDTVAAAMLVMPPRSYHHLTEVLRRKYGAEAVEKVEHEYTTREREWITKAEDMPFNAFDAAMRRLRSSKDAPSVEWYRVMAHNNGKGWEADSLQDLRVMINRMQGWPADVLADAENNPITEVATMYFGTLIDDIWRGDVPSDASAYKELIEDEKIRTALIRALHITFEGKTFDEDLANYLNLEDRGPTRAEVLASPMAEFVRVAGVEKEFMKMVDTVLPA